MPDTTDATETTEPAAPTRADQLRDLALRWWPGWRDVACLALILTATSHLVFNDGGRPLRPMLPVLALAAIATIAAFPTLKRTPRWLQFIALAWVAGPLIALAFADVRAGWVRPVAAWAIALPVAVATLHVLRRRWGATAVTVIVGLSLGLAWYNGLLIWVGGGTARGHPAWMSLSWQDQSGALMAVLGVGGVAFALTRTGWPRVVGVVATVAGLSAAWLSGSRATALTAAAAVLIVLAAAARRRFDRAWAITTAIAVAGSVVAVLALAPMWHSVRPPGVEAAEPPSISTQPIIADGQGVLGELPDRLGQWEAAVRMFAASPVTGTGPGSYGWSSRPWFPDDANPVNSAHGEQLEALGELGIVGGGAALAVTFGLAWLVLASIRRPGEHHLEVAGAGVATLLVAHAALAFDWDYPLLLALLSITAATLVTARGLTPDLADPDAPQSTATPVSPATADDAASYGAAGLATVTTVVALALIATGVAGIGLVVRNIAPWSLDGRLVAAVASATEGDRAAAEERLTELTTWNPGAPRLVDVEALVAHELGDLSDEALAAAIEPRRSAFPDQLRAAAGLLEADQSQLALQLIDDVRPVLDERRAWGVRTHVAQAGVLALAAHHQHGGCADVEAAWPDLGQWLEEHDLGRGHLPQDAPWADCDLTPLQDT